MTMLENEERHMKLIIADLDGTLVHNQTITEQTKTTIKLLKEKGYKFTIATGRHMHATKDIAKMLDVDYPIICTNGGFIYDFKNDLVIHQQIIDESIVLNIMETCNQKKMDYLLYTTKDIIATQKSYQKLQDRIGAFDAVKVPLEALKDYLHLGVVKILIIDEDHQNIQSIKTYLDHIQDVHYVQSQPAFLDIGHHLSSKGYALNKLTEYLNIELSEVFAIGDQENDISMIEVAGIGVAMGNGQEALKKCADFVTTDHANEGFTHAVNQFIFNQKV